MTTPRRTSSSTHAQAALLHALEVHQAELHLQIELSTFTRGGDVVIVVADEGPGIPAEELSFVFDRYRQGAGHQGGAGLGLAIVKGLVEAHHGTVSVTSPVGQGARFEIVLPLADSWARR